MGNASSEPIVIRGKHYASIGQVAEAFNMTAQAVAVLRRYGRLDDIGSPLFRNITVRGVSYADVNAVARAFGVTAAMVRRYIRAGRIDAIGTGRNRNITIRGVTYPKVADAMAALGVSRSAINSAVSRGKLDLVGLSVEERRKLRDPFVVRGRSFWSAREVAEAFGVSTASVYKARSRGQLDTLGLAGVGRPEGARPVAPALARPEADPVDLKVDGARVRRADVPLAEVFHPRWSPERDLQLLEMKRAGLSFLDIALETGRGRVAVEQRYHRLRVVPNIKAKIEAFGVSDAPYPEPESACA